jgi:hypothetical protein
MAETGVDVPVVLYSVLECGRFPFDPTCNHASGSLGSDLSLFTSLFAHAKVHCNMSVPIGYLIKRI